MNTWLTLVSGLIGVLVGAFTSLYAQHREQEWSSRQARDDRAREMRRGALMQLLELQTESLNAAFDLWSAGKGANADADLRKPTHVFNVSLLRLAGARARAEDAELRRYCEEYIEVLHAVVRSGDERKIQDTALAMQDRIAQLLADLSQR